MLWLWGLHSVLSLLCPYMALGTQPYFLHCFPNSYVLELHRSISWHLHDASMLVTSCWRWGLVPTFPQLCWGHRIPREPKTKLGILEWPSPGRKLGILGWPQRTSFGFVDTDRNCGQDAYPEVEGLAFEKACTVSRPSPVPPAEVWPQFDPWA